MLDSSPARQATVLVVDDDADIRDLIIGQLHQENYRLLAAASLAELRRTLKEEAVDLIVLDLNLPDGDGLMLCRELRADGADVQIIMVTARGSAIDRVLGLELGADDYLTKPFNKDELIARITAIVRRSKGHAESVIRTGEIVVNLDSKTVEVEGDRVHLTGKEYQMFELLSLRKGVTLTKEMFLNHLYGGMDEPELKIIDVFICKLRKKLSLACEGENYIETVWGRGYVLRDIDEDGTERTRAA